MSKRTEPKKQTHPLSLRPKVETRAKMEKIAAVNGLSVSDVANMCLAAGLQIVETKLGEIHNTKQAA